KTPPRAKAWKEAARAPARTDRRHGRAPRGRSTETRKGPRRGARGGPRLPDAERPPRGGSPDRERIARGTPDWPRPRRGSVSWFWTASFWLRREVQSLIV